MITRRAYLQIKLADRKRQLAYAYAYGPEDKFHKNRIRQAKMGLIRILLEFHGSPELGPPPKFKWGYRLELMINAGADPLIDEVHTCTFWEAAELLRVSLLFEDIQSLVLSSEEPVVVYANQSD